MKLLVSALEHSANTHLKALKNALGDDVELIGLFDASLGRPIADLRSLAIMGFVDALFKLKGFFALAAQMVELAKEADKILLIDSSGFNLPLAKKLKKAYPNKEIIYYILPQAWAWKRGRIAVLERTIDKLLCILPFEPDYYSRDASIEYVGHPLLDELKELKQSYSTEIKTITYMPGSRRSEIKRLMPILHKVHKRLSTKAYIVVPKHFSSEQIDELYGDLSGFIVTDDAHSALFDSDGAFICSGTATLEASLIGTPFVLSYIAAPLDYMIASRVVKLKYIGLANIITDILQKRDMHPELIQSEVSVDALCAQIQKIDKKQFLEDSKELRRYLKNGSSQRVAQIIKGGV